MPARLCHAGCGRLVPYGSGQTYCSRECQLADTAIARSAKAAGCRDVRDYLAGILNSTSSLVAAAAALGVEESTVRRAAKRLGLHPRRVWGKREVVLVPIEQRRPKRAPPMGQKTLL